jgi:hypothetical protein
MSWAVFNAVAEFLALTIAAIGLGILAHFMKSHMDPVPDQIFGRGDPANLVVPDYDLVNLAAGNEYDEAGYWEYLSLRNLLTYIVLSLLTIWTLRYVIGGTMFRDQLCSAAKAIGLVPLFCG